MIIFRTVTIFILTSIVTNIFACDCAFEGPFLKMAQNYELVALVKISKYIRFKKLTDGTNMPVTMQVEIIEKYKGAETRKEVTVFGDIGHFCRPYLSTFHEGSYYVIAFYFGDSTFGHIKEKASDYYISACGQYWLTVNKQLSLAKGEIDEKNKVISLVNLKRKLNQNSR